MENYQVIENYWIQGQSETFVLTGGFRRTKTILNVQKLGVSVVFSHNKYAYIHIYMFMHDTYWRNEWWRVKTSLKKYTSPLF